MGMGKQQLESLTASLTENNKELLKHVLVPIVDELAFSKRNAVSLSHGGIPGEFLDYEKGLTLLKKLGVIKSFKNTRNGSPVINGTTYVSDKFDVRFDQETLVAFADSLIKRSGTQASKPIASVSEKIIVEPKSYDPANGVLQIAGHSIQIIKQPNQKGTQHESKQARLMRYLFNDVNTLRDGVPMRTIVSVRAYDFAPKHRKLVKSYVSEINKKLPQELLIKELIVTSQYAVMVDSRYLK